MNYLVYLFLICFWIMVFFEDLMKDNGTHRKNEHLPIDKSFAYNFSRISDLRLKSFSQNNSHDICLLSYWGLEEEPGLDLGLLIFCLKLGCPGDLGSHCKHSSSHVVIV